MKWHRGALLAAFAVGLAPSCMGLPTTPPAGKTSIHAGGLIRQFTVPTGNPTRLDLGTAGRLLFAVSASESLTPSFQFRIQAQGPDESRFRAGERALLLEQGALSKQVKRTQGGASSENFWINIGDSAVSGDRLRSANLRLTTPHAYFYVDAEPAVEISPDQIQRLADAFEQRIYPTVTGTFGADPKADLTGDPHVYIVLSPAVDNFGQDKGLMGYFWSRDMLAGSNVPSSPRIHSNQKKVIFLTSRIFSQQPYTTFGTLAHELTHLCVFNQKVLLPGRTAPEDTWLDEAWAMLAMDLCGYGLRGGNDEIAKDIKSFQDQPSLYSLTDWFRNPRGFSYGQSYLFARYLYDRFGAELVRDIQEFPGTGVDAVQGALSRRGGTFQGVFADWAIANAISGLGYTSDPRFRYSPDLNLRGTYGAITLSGVRLTPVTEFPKNLPGSLRPWGTVYYDLKADASRPWSFEFKNPIELFGSAVAVP